MRTGQNVLTKITVQAQTPTVWHR